VDFDDVFLNLHLEGQSSSTTQVNYHILFEQDFLIGSATSTEHPSNKIHYSLLIRTGDVYGTDVTSSSTLGELTDPLSSKRYLIIITGLYPSAMLHTNSIKSDHETNRKNMIFI
jgi:hypothetical protein